MVIFRMLEKWLSRIHALETHSFPKPLEKKLLKELPWSFNPALRSCRSLWRRYIATNGLLTTSILSFSLCCSRMHKPLWHPVTSLWSLDQKAKYHKTAEFQKKRVRNESTSQTCLLLVPAVLNKLAKKCNGTHRTVKDWLMKYFYWQPSWYISSLKFLLVSMPWRFPLANIAQLLNLFILCWVPE